MNKAFTADYVFPVSAPPIRNGVLVTDEHGKIRKLLPAASGQEVLASFGIDAPEVFEGIICPGFINAHCHLELSHLKGKFSRGKGLPHFLNEVMTRRSEEEVDEIERKMVEADREMFRNGIVAVGDICNTQDSFPVKAQSWMLHHNFIELFGLQPDQADEIISRGKNLMREAEKFQLASTLVPHAPYSVSLQLMKRIFENQSQQRPLVCMHNQETESENIFFRERSGELFTFINSIGKGLQSFTASGMNSTASVLDALPSSLKMLLVHNTYSTKEDVNSMQAFHPLTWWCLCPNANEYIENRLPDIPMLIGEKVSLVLGTDSYASNQSMSILEEMKTIVKYFPQLTFSEMLPWATINAAQFFGFDKLGTFEEGKIPGVNLVTGVGESAGGISPNATVSRLI